MKIIANRKLYFIKRYFVNDISFLEFAKLIDEKHNGVFYLDSTEHIHNMENHNYNVHVSLTYAHHLDNYNNDEDMYLSFNKTIRNSINWCKKMNISYKVYDNSKIDKKVLRSFYATCSKMYKEKGLHIRFNKKLIKNYFDSRATVLTTSGNNDVYHLYKVGNNRATLWFSCSIHSGNLKSTEIGKQNRYLHFCDMLWFKENGIKIYDWGGISKTNPYDSVALFKQSFAGGNVINTYTYVFYKGRFIKFLHKLKAL